jgi:two-component system OmpR family response regulator
MNENRADKNGKKVLVIEDEATFRKMFVERLTREGFSILEAADGAEGLRIAMSAKPDAILLDLLMPVMNGIEVLKKLRTDEWGKNVPIIILTNLDLDDPLLREISKNEPSYYLIKKDLEISDVILKLRDCFRRKH